jgi:hypothetical protein
VKSGKIVIELGAALNFQHCVLWLDGASVAYRVNSTASAEPFIPVSTP